MIECAVTARNKMLRDETCIKSLGRIADARTVKSGLRICLERARIMTDVFKRTEGEPMSIRRAKALAAYLDGMTLFTREGELIVGCYASTDKSLPTYPELYWRWLEKAIEQSVDYASMLDAEGKKELLEIHKYWKPMSIHGREREYIPEGRSWRIGEFVSGGWMWQWEITTPNYPKIFSLGMNGIIKEIDQRFREVLADISIGTAERMKMLDELRAMKIACEGVARWGLRYAAMLTEHRKTVKNKKRLAELDAMIEVCKQVPANPARNLHEALQCFIFINYLVNYIDQPQVGNGARFDVIMEPYYKKDIDSGALTRARAKELLESVWVKMQEGGYVQPPVWINNGGGGLGFQTITLGGVDVNGHDVTNDMTYLSLEVTGDLQTIAPQVAVRIHDNTPKQLYEAVFKCVRTGCSQPALYNDKVNIPRLMGLGCPIEEARAYSINNCMQPVIPGKNVHYRAGHSGALVLPMCLVLALSEGKYTPDVDASLYAQGILSTSCKLSGVQVGYPTPPRSTFTSFEDLWKAFSKQLEFAGETLTMLANIADTLLREYVPRPFVSAILDGNIERACDMRDWEYLGLRHHLVFGVNNTADAMAAIKKLVFEEKRFTLDDFAQAIEQNYQGDFEKVFRAIEHEVPKFGNDNDYVDTLSREIMFKVRAVCDKSIDIYGKPYLLDGTTASAPIGVGMLTPPTLDARKANEPFHDGSISPVQGRDTSGPTATIRSVAKIDPLQTGNLLLNQKFMPKFFDPGHYELMEGYLKTVRDMGVHHVQFNCVNQETMMDAKKHPDKHKNLIVRVAGYSAYFVDLDNKMQDEIIKRTEQAF
jgi:choline trimethylamine-lyase